MIAVLPLLVKAVPLAAAAGAELVRRRARKALLPVSASSVPAAGGGAEVAGDRVVGPAYPYLEAWGPELRALLVQVADEIELNPAALATVIQLESRGDPSVPKGDPKTKKLGTPRFGLIQVTVGAKMPGLDSAEKVWAAREWSAERQLRDVVGPFFKRYKGRSPAWTAWDLYQRTFLPALVGTPLDHVVAVRPLRPGEPPNPNHRPDAPIKPGQKLTKGQIYAANPGFDPGDRGFYTWGDVKAKVDSTERAAGGKLITVSGKLLEMGAAPPPAAPASSGKTNAASSPAPAGPAKEPPPAVAAAVRKLLRQVNAKWPQRTKASDGTLGDAAHNARCKGADAGSGLCDHSLGRALDVTLDAEHGPNLDALAAALLRDRRCRYVIWNRKIANPKIDGGAWRPYTGQNPHTRHLHFSCLEELRDDDRDFDLSTVGTGNAGAAAAVVASPAGAGAGELVDVVTAWDKGLVDNVYWASITLGPYELKVATDALSVEGLRLPVSFSEMLALAKRSNYLPHTRATMDAVWAAATRRVVRVPLGPPDDAKTIERYGKLPGQVKAWNEKIGPKAGPGEIVDGAIKQWILTADLKPGAAVNYGLRRDAAGGVWQKPGRRHDDRYKGDPTQCWAPLSRKAKRDGVEVDLVEELAKGAPALMEGVLPPWLVEVLK